MDLRALIRYFLRLGALGFGGPIALVGAMHRDLVERSGALSEQDYREGLALAQLAPGPLAAQLAIYIGYIRGGVVASILVGTAFVLPSFLLVVLIGWSYQRYGGLPWMQGAFYGVGAAVIGLIARSALGLIRKGLANDRLLLAIATVLAVTTAVTGREPVSLVLLGAVVVWGIRAPPAWLGRGASPPEAGALVAILVQLALFFGLAGSVVFGSGLAIVPFLHGGVVLDRAWLTERQYLDAVAVAMITPGPVVITTGFIGYLVAGFPGAVVAAAATFFPCWVFTVIPAPWFRRHGQTPWLKAVVDGTTAGATGAIAGAVWVLGSRSIIDLPTAGIAVAAFLEAQFLRRLPEPFIILLAAGIGLLLVPD